VVAAIDNPPFQRHPRHVPMWRSAAGSTLSLGACRSRRNIMPVPDAMSVPMFSPAASGRPVARQTWRLSRIRSFAVVINREDSRFYRKGGSSSGCSSRDPFRFSIIWLWLILTFPRLFSPRGMKAKLWPRSTQQLTVLSSKVRFRPGDITAFADTPRNLFWGALKT